VIADRFSRLDQIFNDWLPFGDSIYLEKFLRGITFLADTKTLVILSFLIMIWLLLRRNSFRQLILFLAIMGGGVFITFIMKITIERERPGDVVYVDLWGIGDTLVSYGYPSGHAVKAFLYFGFLLYIVVNEMKDRFLKNGIVFIFTAIILFNGFGQVVLEKHYLTDVLGGYLVAITWFCLCLSILQPYRKITTSTGNSIKVV
jgi:undecaprenyl-diphosphatase